MLNIRSLTYDRNWRLAVASIALLLILFFPACRHHHKQGKGEVYHGTGVVESVHRERMAVRIKHEDIKGYMSAMSMPFTVKVEALLDSLQAGDKVEFALCDAESGAVITEIKKL